MLVRNLKGRPPMSDLFGKTRPPVARRARTPRRRARNRRGVPAPDRLPHHRDRARRPPTRRASPRAAEIKRLMTIPGIDVTTAATLIAAIGDIHRFPTARSWSAISAIDPRVRQSGRARLAKDESPSRARPTARHVLVEAAWAAIKTPGPLRAFYQRVRARRGAQVAIIAIARKIACLCWQLLTTEQDYAFKRPTTVDTQAPRARAPRRRADEARHPARQAAHSPTSSGPFRTPTHRASRACLPPTRSATGRPPPPEKGAGAAPGRASQGRQAAQQRDREQPQNLRFSSRSPAPPPTIRRRKKSVHPTLDFHA